MIADKLINTVAAVVTKNARKLSDNAIKTALLCFVYLCIGNNIVSHSTTIKFHSCNNISASTDLAAVISEIVFSCVNSVLIHFLALFPVCVAFVIVVLLLKL
jgi:hypothetical protein